MSIAFPFAFHISVLFHPLFFTCHWNTFVFLLYSRRICTHSVDPPCRPHFLSEFPALGVGTGSDAQCCGPRDGTVVRRPSHLQIPGEPKMARAALRRRAVDGSFTIM